MDQVIEIVELVLDVECISRCKLYLLACTLCYLLKKEKEKTHLEWCNEHIASQSTFI